MEETKQTNNQQTNNQHLYGKPVTETEKGGTHKIPDLYDKLQYVDNYMLQILSVIFITVAVALVVAYCHIANNIEAIKADWPNQRCKPSIIPFAGYIYKDDPSMTASEATKQNLEYCTQNSLKAVSGYALAPLTFAINNLSSVSQNTADGLDSSRTMFNKMRTNMQDVSQEIMGRLANITVPIQQIVISFKDMLAKVQGVMTSALFTSLGTYYTLQAFLGAVAELLIKCLIALAAMIVLMWLMPFTWGMASAMTAVFIGISIPMAVILAFMSETMHVNIGLGLPRVPKKPACFAANVLIKVRMKSDNDVTKPVVKMDIPMKDLHVGQILDGDGGTVTAKMILSSYGQTMYRLSGTDDIIVSGSHSVRYNKYNYEILAGNGDGHTTSGDNPRGWVFVGNHPQARKVEDWHQGDSIVCINSSTKRIIVGGKIFCDWDEILTHSQEILLREKIQDRYKHLMGANNIWDGNVGDLTHRYLDRVIKYGTKIMCNSGISIALETVKLGMQLASGEKDGAPNFVYGIVELEEPDKQTGLHLLTTLGYFYVVQDGGHSGSMEIKTYDYNSCLDAFIV